MTTSGSTSFNPVRDQIIKGALRIVGAYASTDNPRPEQIADALETLNMMLKSWQIENFLWLRQFAVLTLVAGQASYKLGGTAPDACVYQGTATPIDRPTRIFSAMRQLASGYQIPMQGMSRDDYTALPNKAAQGSPVQYYYDPQREQGVIYLWLVPSDATETIVLTVDRTVQDMLADTDTYDFPQEWMEVIKYGLAVRLAPEYGINLSERQILAQEYTSLRENIKSYDHDHVSTTFGIQTVR